MKMIIVPQPIGSVNGRVECLCVLVSWPFPPLSPFFVPKTGFVAEPRERDDETPIPPPSTVPASFLISTVCVILISPDLELAYPAKLSSLSSPLPWRPRRTAHRCKKGFNPGQHLEKKKQRSDGVGPPKMPGVFTHHYTLHWMENGKV